MQMNLSTYADATLLLGSRFGLSILALVARPFPIGIDVGTPSAAANDSIGWVICLEDRDSALVALEFGLDDGELAAVVAQYGPADK